MPRKTREVRAEGNFEKIIAVVRKIPLGKVATYGQVAKAAGLPGHARQVGYALHALGDDTVPWQRVINARGEISARGDPDEALRQRVMLEAEGVEVGDDGRIDLARYVWKPRGAGATAGETRRTHR